MKTVLTPLTVDEILTIRHLLDGGIPEDAPLDEAGLRALEAKMLLIYGMARGDELIGKNRTRPPLTQDVLEEVK